MKKDAIKKETISKADIIKVSISPESGKIQCPICGIICKTKEAYLKHTERRHIKH